MQICVQILVLFEKLKTVQRSDEGHLTRWTNKVLVTSQGGTLRQQTMKVSLELKQSDFTALCPHCWGFGCKPGLTEGYKEKHESWKSNKAELGQTNVSIRGHFVNDIQDTRLVFLMTQQNNDKLKKALSPVNVGSCIGLSALLLLRSKNRLFLNCLRNVHTGATGKPAGKTTDPRWKVKHAPLQINGSS